MDRLLALLEVAYDQEAEDVSELIHVSFLENLDDDSWIWSRLSRWLSAAGRQIFSDEPEYYPPGLSHA